MLPSWLRRRLHRDSWPGWLGVAIAVADRLVARIGDAQTVADVGGWVVKHGGGLWAATSDWRWVFLLVGGFLWLWWSGREPAVPSKVRLPASREVTIDGIERDPDLRRFNIEWNDKATRSNAKRTAIDYVARHPEMHDEFGDKTIPELVALVESHRLQSQRFEAMRTRVDVWLQAMVPPQEITGSAAVVFGSVHGAARGEVAPGPPSFPPDM